MGILRCALGAMLITGAISAHAQPVSHQIRRTAQNLVDVSYNPDGSVFAINPFNGVNPASLVTWMGNQQSYSVTNSFGATADNSPIDLIYHPQEVGANREKSAVYAADDQLGQIVSPPAAPPPPPNYNNRTGQVPVRYNFYDPNTQKLTGFGYVYFNYQNGVLTSISTASVPYYMPPPDPVHCPPENPFHDPNCNK